MPLYSKTNPPDKLSFSFNCHGKLRTTQDVIDRIKTTYIPELPKPPYSPKKLPNPSSNTVRGVNLGLCVPSMQFHMTDEGWQIFLSLEESGYTLCGRGQRIASNSIYEILEKANPYGETNIDTLVLQDKREWDIPFNTKDFRDERDRFSGVEYLKHRNEIFKLTILKDAQHDPEYHRESAEEMNCHAWIIYYHEDIISHLAQYVRPQHLIRTYHTLDYKRVPNFQESIPYKRDKALLSGAVSNAYPMRQKIIKYVNHPNLSPYIDYLPHPGYHRRGTHTPQFLKTLSLYKVAICTSSIYGYALRKIIEATACGCVVITDLPTDEILPYHIDNNLVRIPPDISMRDLGKLVSHLCETYDRDRQEFFSTCAIQYYDYRTQGGILASKIETMKILYNS